MNILSETLGLMFTIVAGFGVRPLLAVLRWRIPIPRISSDEVIQKLWKDLYRHPDRSGNWVGQFERVLLFFALIGPTWEVVGIWLVFKLGAKWEAWNHMGFVPDDPNRRDHEGKILGEEIHLLAWARARRIWAAQGYSTFVVGTAMNLFIAAIGVFIAVRGPEIFECLRL